jgi:nucleoside-diphosphate-sugar epimerase
MILVTGSTGLLGRSLTARLLKAGKRVRAIVHQTPVQHEHPLLETVQGDIADIIFLEEALEGVEEVYHCAGVVSFNPSDSSKIYHVNVRGTESLVNACLQSGVRKLVHVSSVSVLDRFKEDGLIDESISNNNQQPVSKYGETKWRAEMEVWRGMEEGLNAVIVNPSIILGAGNWYESSTAIFKKVYDGLNWYTGGSTGFVDAGDVADAMILLMSSDISHERFILSAENRSFREVMDLIADQFGKPRPARYASESLSSVIWRLEAVRSFLLGTKPMITRDTSRSAHAKVGFDNSKFLIAFPEFRYSTIESCISDTCRKLIESD